MKKKQNLDSSLLIVCALRPEAKPFIGEYNLKQVISEYGFHLLANEEQGISLLIAGQGKVKMAAAMMWASTKYAFSGFLNVGVIGHGDADIGDGLLVNKVTDQATKECFYPMKAFKLAFTQTELITVDEPSDAYEEGMGYDMESSAFLQVARLFVSVEMAQSYKVVSDNSNSHFEKVTADSVVDLMTGHVESVSDLIQKMKQSDQQSVLSASMMGTIESMQQEWHITASQLVQLEQILQLQQVLKRHTKEQLPEWRSYGNVKEYLSAVNQWSKTASPLITEVSMSEEGG